MLARVERILLGGEAVIMGFDSAGKMLGGVRCNPKSKHRWIRNPNPKEDRRRVAELLKLVDGRASSS